MTLYHSAQFEESTFGKSAREKAVHLLIHQPDLTRKIELLKSDEMGVFFVLRLLLSMGSEGALRCLKYLHLCSEDE